MDKYHLQVSLDTFINAQHSSIPKIQSNKIIVDTITTATQYILPPLSKNTKYFWRVAGVNSEGESRWSDVWNFTTGVNADVQVINNSKLALSSFPNPTSKELNIPYVLPERGNARLILYDLEGRIIRENRIDAGVGEHLLKWDVSRLPSGSYVLGLVTKKETKSEIVQIIR